MTRATYLALHGDFSSAFRMNPLGVVLFPVALAACAIQLGAWALGKQVPPLSPARWHLAWWFFGLLVLYTVLRNIPAWPFTLLAPH